MGPAVKTPPQKNKPLQSPAAGTVKAINMSKPQQKPQSPGTPQPKLHAYTQVNPQIKTPNARPVKPVKPVKPVPAARVRANQLQKPNQTIAHGVSPLVKPKGP